jgi:hypothetical protein
MDNGRIAVMVALVAGSAAIVLSFLRDYRSCQSFREKWFVVLMYFVFAALLIIPHALLLAFALFAVLECRWRLRQRRENIRFLKSLQQGQRQHPALEKL